MDKRKTLKVIRTPDNSFNLNPDDTLFLETPNIKSKQKKNVKYYDTTDINIQDTFEQDEPNTFLNKCTRIFEKLISTSIFLWNINFVKFFLIFSCAFFFENFLHKKNNFDSEILTEIKKDFLNLQEETTNLSLKLTQILQTPTKPKQPKITQNYALPETGASICYTETSPIYKHWLFRFITGKDPLILLTSNLLPTQCFSFNGTTGKIRINFKKPIKISHFSIFHPNTKNKTSAPKDFEIQTQNTTLHTYKYDITNTQLQTFNLHTQPTTNNIIFHIKNNHGNTKYTSIYRIYIFGENI
ncbi:spindle pole body-associated protein Sad1 [Hamiltosporidium tvaerminnensis]|uniref:Spindle pole body-associated protein Sad1 n=1 Tax=Hamiltosporidium tvaerminnensis TaxID=1176355 RepID=A0A4Q9LAR1_9MICR|nr:SUN domain-containing protein 3 [Hamiltosporidium tvaerminnensis]TBU04405.1 spindle pole body-associated protein Sad1 [Hamiltosporidium tvaerminnensis]